MMMTMTIAMTMRMDDDDDDGDFFFATCPRHQDFKDDDNAGVSDNESHVNE